LSGGQELPRMELLWADGAYTGGFREWLSRQLGWRMEVPHHRDRQLWRYGLDDQDPPTLAELAAELKLSRERIRQLQREAEFLLKTGARRVPRGSVA
jgi:DNA-directed RNA polymerase sigma subunit (sigma70/sigma32)